MHDRTPEPMTQYEARLGRDLRAASDGALRPFDSTVVTRSAAAAAGTRDGWLGLLRTSRTSLLVAATLLALALLGGVLLVGNMLREQVPFPRLGNLAYELDGDVWIANADGTEPVRIADGDERLRFQSPHWAQDGACCRCMRTIRDPTAAR